LEGSLLGGLKDVGGPGAKETFLFFLGPVVVAVMLLSTEAMLGSGEGMSLRGLVTLRVDESTVIPEETGKSGGSSPFIYTGTKDKS
jgi:hypothetical protein